MHTTIKYTRNFSKQLIAVLLITCAMCFTLPFAAVADETPSTSFDGLETVEDAAMAMAYINPNADFGAFKRVMILEPFVAFQSNWERDQRRGSRSASGRVSARDMERIKADVASMFREVFTDVLEANDGFEVVDEADYDVLLLRPAIIDLDITAPDTNSAGRSRTFVASAGAATVYIELFDSVSGSRIGRAADRRAARNTGGTMSWNSRVMNRSEGRRMMTVWAERLRTFLDSHYTKATEE
jgi:hypothetical protein